MSQRRNPLRRPESMLPPPVTISIALVHGMLSGIRARGEAVEGYMTGADIAPELLEQASARVTAEQYIALFQLLIDERNDEALGFLSRPLKRGSFALIAREGVGAPTLETAMRRMSRTFTLLQDDVVLKPVRDGDAAGLELRLLNRLQVHPEFLHNFLLRVSWRTLAWLMDARLPVTAFDFAFERPAYFDSYTKVFPAPARFSTARSAFWFEADQLSKNVRRDQESLRKFLAASPGNVIIPRRDEGVAHGVRSQLQRMLPRWGDLGTVASALFMSPSTLQRRLAAEKTTFQLLKDELRRDIAITRLNTSMVSLAALADELGFADSAAFQRAFKGWTGSAPGVYRQGNG
jgi:AraC-like DNA-binding protein